MKLQLQSAVYRCLYTKASNELEENELLEELLVYLKRSCGFDFTGYKHSYLIRRISKRMQRVGIGSYRGYIDYLKVHPEEFTSLFNTILINFTSFFRDRSVWDYLTNKLVPEIVASKVLNEPIRVWSAGCASGEEAYTLAIILAEALGVEQFRERVKIYATDIDEEALNQSLQADYMNRMVTGISSTLLEKYFERTANAYIFRKDLRCSLIFSRHNLIKDAPISQIDILTCRNVLMYLKPETQKRILSYLYKAVQNSGFLLLGQAESVRENTHTFTPVDLKLRIYEKTLKVALLNQGMNHGLRRLG